MPNIAPRRRAGLSVRKIRFLVVVLCTGLLVTSAYFMHLGAWQGNKSPNDHDLLSRAAEGGSHAELAEQAEPERAQTPKQAESGGESVIVPHDQDSQPEAPTRSKKYKCPKGCTCRPEKYWPCKLLVRCRDIKQVPTDNVDPRTDCVDIQYIQGLALNPSPDMFRAFPKANIKMLEFAYRVWHGLWQRGSDR